MNKLLAKFKVGSVTDFGNNNQEVKMTPVVSGSEENKSFSIYTPSGDCRLHITNPNALNFFKAADEVYVEFKKQLFPESDKEWLKHNHIKINAKYNESWGNTKAYEFGKDYNLMFGITKDNMVMIDYGGSIEFQKETYEKYNSLHQFLEYWIINEPEKVLR
jgi:hypothetical protein